MEQRLPAESDITKIREGTLVRYQNRVWLVKSSFFVIPSRITNAKLCRFQLKEVGTEKEQLIQMLIPQAEREIILLEVVQVPLILLYREEQSLVCRHPTSGDELIVPLTVFESPVGYLKKNITINASFEGAKIVYAILPHVIEMEVTEIPLAGNDISPNSLRPVLVDSGATVNVPGFIKVGDKIKIFSNTGTFVGRAN